MKWKFWVRNVFDLAHSCQVDCHACAPIFIFLTDPYPAYMSESSLDAELCRAAKGASQRVRTVFKKNKKNTTQQRFRRSAGVFQVRNLKTNSDSYWIMHEQTASSRDKPRINVSPWNPRAEARRRRRGQERRRQIESGRTERRVKVRIQLKPKWMRKAAPRLPSDRSAPWRSCG